MHAAAWILLAQHSRPGNPGASGQQQGVFLGFLIIAAVIAGIWAIAQMSALRRAARASRSPRRLFLSLCRAHRLSWSQRWLLWRVARAHGFKNPARVFLERNVSRRACLGRDSARRPGGSARSAIGCLPGCPSGKPACPVGRRPRRVAGVPRARSGRPLPRRLEGPRRHPFPRLRWIFRRGRTRHRRTRQIRGRGHVVRTPVCGFSAHGVCRLHGTR